MEYDLGDETDGRVEQQRLGDRHVGVLWVTDEKVRNDNRRGQPFRVHLVAICGSGDDAEPVITIMLPDAPLPDEIAIICAFANRGRPNHRVGGLAVNEIKGVDGLT